MFTAKIAFPKANFSAGAASDAAIEVLACWLKNGQVVGDEWSFTDSGTAIDAYVTIPERDSLEPVHNNRYAKEALTRLQAEGHELPAVTVLGADPAMDAVCSCASPSALVLFTHYLTTEPPVRCLDCFRPVPLYRLPPDPAEEHLALLAWADTYRACDTLQMLCTTGERFAEQQLYRHDSSLSRSGRDECARLEALISKPVYYWLMKVRSRGQKHELARKCPSCGGEWRLEQRLCDLFDFRCERCRLLSAIAFDAS